MEFGPDAALSLQRERERERERERADDFASAIKGVARKESLITIPRNPQNSRFLTHNVQTPGH
jgi:hypothetical protein